MITTDELTNFVAKVEYDDLSEGVCEELEKCVLDSVGIAASALGEKSIEIIHETV